MYTFDNPYILYCTGVVIFAFLMMGGDKVMTLVYRGVLGWYQRVFLGQKPDHL